MAGIRLDHLVIAATSLETGRAWAEAKLGVPAAGGGRHATMGTHNALWALGNCYLEVIAVDPEGVRPARPRWLGFDDDETRERLARGPCLLTWAVAVDDLGTIRPPVPHSAPQDFARDDLRWQVMLPEGAALPLGGAWPLTIHWMAGLHPAKRLPDQGLRLKHFEIAGSGAAEAEAALGPVEGPVSYTPGEGPLRLQAEISTPSGTLLL